MWKYIIKRILSIIPVLIIVSIITFSFLHMIPGDIATTILGNDATEEEVLALQTRLGLDKPVVEQYFLWIGNMLKGDFGTSIAANGASVKSMIASHFLPTIQLAVFALIVALIIALPLGILAAKFRGRAVDYTVTVIALLGISVPSFLLGIGLMMLLGVDLRILPVSGYKPMSAGFVNHIRTLIMPGISLGFMYAALIMRMTRASMLEVLNSDYIRMAKAKGVKDTVILTKHAFRNALVTIITVVGQSFIGALSGAAVTETLFGIPGIGSLIVTSIGRRDYQVIQAAVLLIACINVVINLVVDLLYGVIDPRVRTE